ncbi:mCG144670, partial [Mus musculus]
TALKIRNICHTKKKKKKFKDAQGVVPPSTNYAVEFPRIWGQYTQSAMDEPRSGEITCIIMVFPLPGFIQKQSSKF